MCMLTKTKTEKQRQGKSDLSEFGKEGGGGEGVW